MFGFGGQLIILALGLIVPRMMISSYGSDVNGLVSTITQIFSYMALLEAGIGQAAKNALYKPIIKNDKNGISEVASIARSYFRRITLFYGIGVILLSVLLPLILKTDVDYLTVFLIVFFEGMSGVVTFYFIQTQTVILMADGRGYVNNGVTVVNKSLSYGVKIFMAYFGMNIAFLQLIYFLITIVKVFFYTFYFRKNYPWLHYRKTPRSVKLKDRNSFIITELAWTLFSSTDMIVLSMFVSTQLASVYSVYNLIFTSLNVLLNAVYTSVNYMLGQTYHKDRALYPKVHDSFMSLFVGSMTIMVSIAYVLILPFVQLYTRGVNDINYIYAAMPVLFSMVQLLSWSRNVTGNLTGVAGYAKQVSIISLIEAFTNIIASVVLVFFFGIIGVLFATVIALPIKVIYCAYLADKKIMNRSYWNTIKILGSNYALFAVVAVISQFFELPIHSYLDLILYGIPVGIVCAVLGVAVNLLVNPYCLKLAKQLKRRKPQKSQEA